ncbi:hypothetical protein FRC00_010753 [Tulasnella sp. 408]|nr:hypothetical protein FRC00_010753 [Tulasnella sp. 408]
MADPPNMEFTAESLDKLKTYAAHLPYSIEPNSEMQNLLDFYLTRITQCIEAKDYDPGFLQWDSMLNYYHLLKYPIPKPKRIALAKVYFDICVTSGMPLHVVNTCLDTLNFLLRSKKKLSVDDLRLPWKPIYHILSKDLFLSRRQFEIRRAYFLRQMAQLAELTRRFFHPACADEMVDTILPSFNGLDLNSVLATQYYLNTFLPLSHPTWLPMLMRIWSAVNSYMFDERHFALLAQLAEIHLDPTISDPRRIDEIPDDARLNENGLPEDGPRLRWSTGDAQDPSSSVRGDVTPRQKIRRQTLGINGIEGLGLANGAYGHPGKSQPSKPWTGIFKDIGIFTQEEWDLIMCKCLASMEIPLADAGSFMTGPVVDEQASFEFSRLPKSHWRIYSLAKLIVYSMAPDGKQLPHSGTATPFEIPVSDGGGYFNIPLPKAEKSYLAGCKALDSLAKLIVSLESFFHPSNGSYTTDLSAFLKYIVFEFSKRWHHETLPDCKVPMVSESPPYLKRFLPYAIQNIRSELDHGASSVRTTTYSHIEPSDATLHWNIAILRGSLYHGGKAVLEYKDDLSSVIDALHRRTFSKRGFSYTGKLLYSLLDTLTQIYTLEDRFVNPDEWDSESFRSGHHRYWGRLYAAEDVEIQWHTPSSEEVVFVLELLNRHVEPTLSTLESLVGEMATRNEAWENDFCRHLSFVRNAFAALPTIRQEFMSEDEILESCASSDVL